jgi:hypothetical protein
MKDLTGKLSGMRAFISGAIDRVADDGVEWRNNIKGLCKKKNIFINFLDPCDKPEELGQEIGKEKYRMENLKSLGKDTWKEAQKEVKKFKRIDYRMVDMCDIYIVYIDINVHMCGSYFECKVAEEERKPILMILADGMKKADLPTWLVDLVNYDEMFLSVEECVDYLEKIDNGIISFDDRLIKVD